MIIFYVNKENGIYCCCENNNKQQKVQKENIDPP